MNDDAPPLFRRALDALITVFSGGAGQTIGKVTAFGALVAALMPGLIAALKSREDVFIVITIGQLFFWGCIVFVVIIVVYLTRPGRVRDRHTDQ